ncbi:MAG: NAD-dependent epimerase/dehydratase family protein, partial [Flavobacteriales bacterium]|nr:NAD-dependent epimerase/dehydratase family protein [Flavobacteriales bacterium]
MHLITGATGIVGTRLMLELLLKGESVRALRRASSNLSWPERIFEFLGHSELFESIEWVEGDVTDVESLIQAMNGVRFVYHTAAVVSFHRRDIDVMFKVNVEGTANVVNVAASSGVEKVCHISSTAAVGRSESGQLVTEETEWKDSPLNSAYAITKRNAEREVFRSQVEGLQTVVINPSVIVGPGDRKRSSAVIFSKVDEGLKFYPLGANAFVGVKDVARAAILLMESATTGDR